MTEPIWEDQGLYFTLIFNSIVIAVVLIVGFVLHKLATNARALRPNRPGSETATLFTAPMNLTFTENEVLEQCGVQPMIHILMLKLMAFTFSGMLLTAVVIVAICATDTYMNDFRLATDPDSCRGKGQSSCDENIRCTWIAAPVSQCGPVARRGLFDFSVQNLTPGESSWRLYIFAIACVVCLIPVFFMLRGFLRVLYNTIRSAYTYPLHEGHRFGAMSTVGARTVLVSGLPSDAVFLTSAKLCAEFFCADAEKRKELLAIRVEDKKDGEAGPEVSAAKKEPIAASPPVPAEKSSDNNPTDPSSAEVFPQEDQPASREPDAHSSTVSNPTPTNASPAKYHVASAWPAPADLTSASWALMKHLEPESIVTVRCAPDDMMSLMADEKDILTEFTDAVAAVEKEEDAEKKAKAKEEVEKQREKLTEVRDKLREKVVEVPTQDMTGVVFLTFDRASTAYAFVRQYNDEQGVASSSTAMIAGPRDGIFWHNLAISQPLMHVRFVVMVVIFGWLVFFWGIPVGFLGSLENLAGIPGFAAVLGVIPTTVLGTLSAYLPTIVITVFNILLPVLFRAFCRLGGLKNVDQESRSVFMMCGIFSIMSGIVMQAALQGGFAQAVKLFTDPSWEAGRALIIAIVSPSGGYWYSFLITAACLGMGINFLQLGPVIVSNILGKIVGRQEAYDKLFDPRPTDFAFSSGRHLFFAAIGMLFHGTVAFLQPFAVLYTFFAYLVERSLMIDGGARDNRYVINYSYVLSYVHCILTLHSVACAGSILLCALKLNTGGSIISALAFLGSLGFHIFTRMNLHKLIFLTPEYVAVIERDTELLGYAREDFKDVPRYVPDYTTYKIDEDAVPKIEATKFNVVDKEWPKPDWKKIDLIGLVQDTWSFDLVTDEPLQIEVSEEKNQLHEFNKTRLAELPRSAQGE